MLEAMDVPEIISRYFQLASSADRESYFALFADDAVVTDEGNTYRGVDAIRAWRTTVPPVTYSVADIETSDNGKAARVTAEIAGDFPGSPVMLRFEFGGLTDQLIGSLKIAP
jgi:hypothetical protein